MSLIDVGLARAAAIVMCHEKRKSWLVELEIQVLVDMFDTRHSVMIIADIGAKDSGRLEIIIQFC